MSNSLWFIVITLCVRVLQVGKVCLALCRGQTTFYPRPVKLFESQFKKLCQCSEALMFCNATSAMEAALFAGGVKSGQIVGTTAFVISSSYAPASHLGAQLRFYDIAMDDLNLNVDLLLSDSTELAALIVTHFYGVPCDMERIVAWAKKRNVLVVEDCSHAHGAMCQGRPIGTWGDVGVFSLQGAKTVSAGEGAVAITNNSELMLRMAAYGHQESYKKFGINNENDLSLPPFGSGKKMRAHPLGAVLALEDLRFLGAKNKIFSNWTSEIKEIASQSGQFLVPSVSVDSIRGGFCQGIPIILHDERLARELRETLIANRVNCFERNYTDNIIQFSNLLNEQDVKNRLPNSFSAFTKVLFIPFNQFVLPWRWYRLMKVLQKFNGA